MSWLRRLGVDGFLLGLIAAVGLAWLYPAGGARGGLLQPELVNRLGVALVFFLNGAKIPSEVLRRGLVRWRIHALIQSFTYLVFPLLGLALMFLARPLLGADFSLGLFFLCSLPSTVTSSVALISASDGDVSLGIFNATLSTAVGVVLTPLWLAAVISPLGGASHLIGAFSSLLGLVIAPLVVGQLLRGRLQGVLSRYRAPVRWVDRSVILLLVHTSFCNSFQDELWSGYSLGLIASVVACSVFVFWLMSQLCSAASTALGLEEGARRAVVLVGSQKSLAVGVPMSQVLFGDAANVGLILLPLMIYHPLQLAISGVLVQRWAGREVLTHQ